MIDPYRTNVKLLLHCDSLLDEVSAANVGVVGTAAVSTSQSVFGSGSIYLNGSGSRVTRPDSADWDFGAGEFTLEMRVRFSATPSNATLICQWNGTGWALYFASGSLFFRAWNGAANVDTLQYTWSPTLNQWYAVAFDRDGSGNARLYVNGAMVKKTTSYTVTIADAGAVISVGGLTSPTGFDLNGYVDEVRVTKGTARYASDSGYTVLNEPFSLLAYEPASTTDGIGIAQSDTPNARYALSQSGGIGINGLTYAGAQVLQTLTSGIALALAQKVTPAPTVAETITVALTQTVGQAATLSSQLRSQDFITPTKRLSAATTAGVGIAEALKRDIGFVLRERIGIAELGLAATKYGLSATDVIRTAAALTVGRLVNLTGGIGMHDVSSAVIGAFVLERLGLRDVLLPAARYGQTSQDRVRISDALRRFIGGSFADTLGMHDSNAPKFLIGRALTDNVDVHDAVTPKLLVRITLADSIRLTPVTALMMLFKPTLLDAIEVSAAHVSPNGTITTWVVNTRTGAVTEYGNYEFNSFAQRGHKYLGASSTGLYELNGDDDQGADIIARIKSGWAQFAGSRYSMFKAAYLGVHGSGDVFFKVEAGTGETYTYQVVVQDMQTTKVRMGKGLRARYFSFELVTTGQDFDLDTIEFVPIVAQRRV